MEKIKVVWICSFSNPEIRSYLSYKKVSLLEKLLYKFAGRDDYSASDCAIWNTNAIKEFEKFDNVDLHVICPSRGLRKKICQFDLRGVNYYFFREENSSLIRKIVRQLFTKNNTTFKINRKNISQLINQIKPDLVHVIGVENPQYSLAALDVPTSIPLIVQLQALLIRVADVTENPKEKVSFKYKGELEKQIIQRADYIGTTLADFTSYVRKYIKKDAVILKTTLAMANNIDFADSEKSFDFVYFAANINKSGTDAIEAFKIAFVKNPAITLDVIGGYDKEFKQQLIEKLRTVGAENAVTFEGLLPTHDDVIDQIRKSRFALLPLKMDFVPNTIHEAMSNGLPVITTITDGTPNLNIKRSTVLLSPIGDNKAMADNMLLLLNNSNLAVELRNNAGITEREYSSNEDRMKKWVEAYTACISNFNHNESIPSSLLMD